jgi:hypothetical protein
LDHGVPAVLWQIYFFQWSPRFRFVLFLTSSIFTAILSHRYAEQVIAPLLIIQRVANQRTLTSGTIVSGTVDPIRFKSERDSANDNAKPPSELGVGVETAVELYHSDVEGLEEPLRA